MTALPMRQTLHHQVPSWVKGGSIYFVTICTEPRGQNQLCRAETGRKLLDSAVHYHANQRWWLKLFLLMPDHVHALIAVPSQESLPTVIRVWKSYQTKNIGIQWQAGFFDHRLRANESEGLKADYIRANPVKSGLITRAQDWPYVWPKSAGRA